MSTTDAHQEEFSREVSIPTGAVVSYATVRALGQLVVDLIGVGLGNRPDIYWSVNLERRELRGETLEALEVALQTLKEIPEGIHVLGRHWKLGPESQVVGTISADLWHLPRVALSGSDRAWVAQAEDRMREFVEKRFVAPRRRRDRPRTELVAGALALAAGLAVAELLSLAGLPLAIIVAPVSLTVTAVFVLYLVRAFWRSLVAPREPSLRFVPAEGDGEVGHLPWYQHPAAETLKLVLALLGGLWVLIQLGVFVSKTLHPSP